MKRALFSSAHRHAALRSALAIVGSALLVATALGCGARGDEAVQTKPSSTISPDGLSVWYSCVPTGTACDEPPPASESACTATPACEWTLPNNGCSFNDGGPGVPGPCPTSADTTAETCAAVNGCFWTAGTTTCATSCPSALHQGEPCLTGCKAIAHVVGQFP